MGREGRCMLQMCPDGRWAGGSIFVEVGDSKISFRDANIVWDELLSSSTIFSGFAH